jgi:hypothetical protein
MKFKVKLAAFALSAGVISFGVGTCFFRWMGDLTADALWARGLLVQ